MMFKHQNTLMQYDVWKEFQDKRRYVTRKVYLMLRGVKLKVHWIKHFYVNLARPRAKFILWLTCLERLPTKDRLPHFGVITDGKCVFCDAPESSTRLLFECDITKNMV